MEGISKVQGKRKKTRPDVHTSFTEHVLRSEEEVFKQG